MNTRVNWDPDARFPLLKLPPLAVTVWTAASLLVQVTVLLTPITTVIVPGLKEEKCMFTFTVDIDVVDIVA